MPTNVVKTPRDERLWSQAKAQVEKEYGLSASDGKRFYQLVMSIYERMKSGNVSKSNVGIAFLLNKGWVKGHQRKSKHDISFAVEEYWREDKRSKMHLMHEIEYSIKNYPTENGFVFNIKGELLWNEDDGYEDSISVQEPYEMGILKGSVFTHNHPNGKSFSPKDIDIMLFTEIKEIRAVSDKYVYVARKPIGFVSENRDNFFATMNKIAEEIERKIFDAVKNKKITVDESHIIHMHEVWMKMSEKTGLYYERRKQHGFKKSQEIHTNFRTEPKNSDYGRFGLHSRFRNDVKGIRGRTKERIEKGLKGTNKTLAQHVYDYLKQNYPPDLLDWVPNERWEEVKHIPLKDIKMARRPGGARDTDKVNGIAQAIRDGEKMDPVVLVQTSDGYKIADGYHRTLAHKHAGKKSIHAYVATGEHDAGVWDEEMHRRKLNKSFMTFDSLREEGEKAMQGKSIMELFRDEFMDYASTLGGVNDRPLLEAIASRVHEQWINFVERVVGEIDPDHAEAWKKMFVPYDELDNKEKEKDRSFARRIIATILEVTRDEQTVNKALTEDDERADFKVVDGALIKAYEKAYRGFVSDKNEGPDTPQWSKRAEGAKGSVWRASDGWGEWYFLQTSKGSVEFLATRMADVMAYHFYPAFQPFTKTQGITRNNFKDKLGFGDSKWDTLMKKFVSGGVNKSVNAGEARTTMSPQAYTAGRQKNLDPFMMEQAADNQGNAEQDVYALYRKIMGHEASGEVSVESVSTAPEGSVLRLYDGKITMRVFVPRVGMPRLLKALRTYTPAPNIVWSILRHAGYEFKVVGGVATLPNAKVSIKNSKVAVEGKEAEKVMRLLVSKMKDKQTSEDWVGGHQRLGIDYMAVKPW